jgi:hypothetical protein
MMLKIISQYDVTHYDVTNKNNYISFEEPDIIITSITAHPIRLAVILVIMSVSIFTTAVILYIKCICCIFPGQIYRITAVLKFKSVTDIVTSILQRVR